MIQHLGNKSSLTPFRKKQTIARTLTDRNAYSKMVEDEALVALNGGPQCPK